MCFLVASSGVSASSTSSAQRQGSTSRLGEQYSYLLSLIREEGETMKLYLFILFVRFFYEIVSIYDDPCFDCR